MSQHLNRKPGIFKDYKIYFFLTGLIILTLIFFFLKADKPTSFRGMINKAQNYAEQGKIAYALEEYKKIVRLYPDNYDVHLKLAELYEQLNDPDKAKVEYIMAIRLGKNYRHEATFGLIEMYVKENKYNIANDIAKELKDPRNPESLKRLGDFYNEWGNKLSEGDRLEAIRKYKKAREYYKKAGNKKAGETLDKINRVYANIADYLLKNNQKKKAIEILNLSILYEDNALAHYKLAKIYAQSSDIEKAIQQYSKAFELDPKIGNYNSYVSLLMQQAKAFEKKGDDARARLYYRKAKKLDSNKNIPDNPDARLLFSLIATKINEDLDRDILIPGIIFSLTNITDKPIEKIKVKIVFKEDNKSISKQTITVADEENPLKGDSKTSDISIYSDRPVEHVFDDHDLMVQVYVSQGEKEKWKLYRNIPIIRNRKSIMLKN